MIRSKQIAKKHLVLIVDDHEINRDALGVILEDDYEVIYATNGKEALAEIEAHINALSIIMLDLVMPVMDGFEVLEHVRNDDRMKIIPIIVLTAERNAELKALQMGAADFITKPFVMPEVILARVARIIELSEGRQLISAAEKDYLTDLYNPNFFFEYANRLYQYHRDMRMDAVVVNVDQFHMINAANGRSFGDDVLRTIGEEIRAFLSKTDGIASRLEADKFNIYCAHQDDYSVVLNSFQEKLNSVFNDVNIHLRMGIMPWVEGVEPTLLFDRASAACNLVRGKYQNPIMVYNEEMLKEEILKHRLLNDLQAAVEERQLMVFYQPKYNIQCDPPRLSSAEALIRWKHPEMGMISPGKFIPLFEGNGLISIIDNFVWQEVARQVAQWRDKYGITMPVSVNLSRAEIFDPSLQDTMTRLIQDNNLDAKSIKLEVTESSYTVNETKMFEVINRLRDVGFEIEIDDFGSGYSTLNMLSAMPFDVLKMDMKFVQNIEKERTDMHLVKLVLDIAKYIDVPVVAEGIETEGQLKLLKNAGCALVQGYYFSRPLPAEEFENLIQREIAITRSNTMTLQELYQKIGGDYNQAIRVLRMEKLMDKHIRKLPKNGVVDALLKAGETMDPVQIFEAAHAVKGVCANLGLTGIAETASDIAEEYRPGNARGLTDEQVTEKIARVDQLYRHTVEVITQYEEENK